MGQRRLIEELSMQVDNRPAWFEERAIHPQPKNKQPRMQQPDLYYMQIFQKANSGT